VLTASQHLRESDVSIATKEPYPRGCMRQPNDDKEFNRTIPYDLDVSYSELSGAETRCTAAGILREIVC
jgi:hypothetical protein